MGKVVKTDDEWRAALDDLAYKVTRKHATERAGTHDAFPSKAGTCRCVCCDAPLFDQAAQFESGTGWPSFFAPLQGDMAGEQPDNSWFSQRTEVHCNRSVALLHKSA